MLEKTARKPSMDPAQEKLRQHKANWNKEISSFINDVIHIKKMMNGWPSKYYKERSRITAPMPVDANALLGQMASRFNELAQEGNTISQEQAQYSKTRRMPRKQQGVETLNKLDEKYGPTEAPVTPPVGGAPSAPPAGGDLAKQLSAFEQKYGEELVAEGSNKMTRLWTRLVNPTIGWGSGTKRRRERMNMLKRSAKIYKQLNKLQVRVVAPLFGQESVKDSYEIVHDIKNEWDLIKESFEDYKKLMDPKGGVLGLDEEKLKQVERGLDDSQEEKPQEQGSQSVPPAASNAPAPSAPAGPAGEQLENAANEIRNELRAVQGGKIYSAAAFAPLQASIDKFLAAKLLSPERPAAAQEVINNYQALLASLSGKFGVPASSLKDLEAVIQLKDASSEYQLEAVSQAFIKKWIGKARHNMFPGETSTYRLAIFEASKIAREEMKTLMNLLERRATPIPDLERTIVTIDKALLDMRLRMYTLYRVMYRSFSGRKERKEQQKKEKKK